MKRISSTVAAITVTTLLTASAFANTTPLKHSINGTWCSTDNKDTYALFEHNKKPFTWAKNGLCYTFNVVHTVNDTAVGRWMLTSKNSPHRSLAGLNTPEKGNPGYVTAYDIGTFAYIKHNQPTLVAVDAIDESITRLSLNGDQLQGTSEEVTDHIDSKEAHVIVMNLARTTATIPKGSKDFNARWEKIYQDSTNKEK